MNFRTLFLLGVCILGFFGDSYCANSEKVSQKTPQQGRELGREEGKKLLAEMRARKEHTLVIPSDVGSIGERAFSHASDIYHVIIPSNVSKILPEAFVHCSGIKSITLEYGVLDIFYDAFYECRNIKLVHIPGSVRHIGDWAFGPSEPLFVVNYSFDDEKSTIEKELEREKPENVIFYRDVAAGVARVLNNKAFRLPPEIKE